MASLTPSPRRQPPAVSAPEQSSDMVERVTNALLDTYDFVGPRTAERCAKAALEASHHAQLVEELKRARAYLCVSVAATDSTMRPLYSKDEQSERLVAITDLLAKLGGDA
jgi:hypothetical protein